jgi:putative hemolysin
MSDPQQTDQGGQLDEGILLGQLVLRLARSEAEMIAAQRLRYRVFYEEMAATPIGTMAAEKRDFDRFDAICDHLLVLDSELGSGPEAVVGTYRLLRRSVAVRHGDFYTAGEYDISKILAVKGELVELGRSCVDARYRSGATVQALLRGLGAYADQYDIRIMFGCASLHGTDPKKLALPLSYIHHRLLAPEELRPRALDHLYVDMNLIAEDEIDSKEGHASLPPLIKGYARAGCRFGSGAVIDEQFNTTDVCVMLDLSATSSKYRQRFTHDDTSDSETDRPGQV